MDQSGENVIYVQVDEHGRVINYTSNLAGGEQVLLIQEGENDQQQLLYGGAAVQNNIPSGETPTNTPDNVVLVNQQPNVQQSQVQLNTQPQLVLNTGAPIQVSEVSAGSVEAPVPIVSSSTNLTGPAVVSNMVNSIPTTNLTRPAVVGNMVNSIPKGGQSLLKTTSLNSQSTNIVPKSVPKVNAPQIVPSVIPASNTVVSGYGISQNLSDNNAAVSFNSASSGYNQAVDLAPPEKIIADTNDQTSQRLIISGNIQGTVPNIFNQTKSSVVNAPTKNTQNVIPDSNNSDTFSSQNISSLISDKESTLRESAVKPVDDADKKTITCDLAEYLQNKDPNTLVYEPVIPGVPRTIASKPEENSTLVDPETLPAEVLNSEEPEKMEVDTAADTSAENVKTTSVPLTEPVKEVAEDVPDEKLVTEDTTQKPETGETDTKSETSEQEQKETIEAPIETKENVQEKDVSSNKEAEVSKIKETEVLTVKETEVSANKEIVSTNKETEESLVLRAEDIVLPDDEEKTQESVTDKGAEENVLEISQTEEGNVIIVSPERKRGRPRKYDKDGEPIKSSPRQTPRQKSEKRPNYTEVDTETGESTEDDVTEDDDVTEKANTSQQSSPMSAKKGRGRPRKSISNEAKPVSPKAKIATVSQDTAPREPKRGRGRPPKGLPTEEANDSNLETSDSEAISEPKKKGRGRPRKSLPADENVDSNSEKEMPVKKSFMANFDLISGSEMADLSKRRSKRISFSNEKKDTEPDEIESSPVKISSTVPTTKMERLKEKQGISNIFDIFANEDSDKESGPSVFTKLKASGIDGSKSAEAKLSKLQTVNAELKTRLREMENKQNKFTDRSEIKALQTKVEKLTKRNEELKATVKKLENSASGSVVLGTIEKKIKLKKNEHESEDIFDIEELKNREANLDRREAKLRALDRELDDRTASLKAKEGKLARMSQQLKSKERELEFKEQSAYKKLQEAESREDMYAERLALLEKEYNQKFKTLNEKSSRVNSQEESIPNRPIVTSISRPNQGSAKSSHIEYHEEFIPSRPSVTKTPQSTSRPTQDVVKGKQRKTSESSSTSTPKRSETPKSKPKIENESASAPPKKRGRPSLQSPAAIKKTPKSKSKTPAPKSKTPVSNSKTPVSKSKTPISKSKTPVSKSQTPVSKSKTPVSKSQTPVAKSQTPVAKSRTPATKATPTAKAYAVKDSKKKGKSPPLPKELQALSFTFGSDIHSAKNVSGSSRSRRSLVQSPATDLKRANESPAESKPSKKRKLSE